MPNPSLANDGPAYTGQQHDPETAGSGAEASGLYYYRARMYSPAFGRFLEADPAGDSATNLYAYVGNDPLDTPAYVAAAAAYSWFDIKATRTVAGTADVFNAKFNADDFGGRLETGYRLDGVLADLELASTPYAALEGTQFHTPRYTETAPDPTASPALIYAPNTTSLLRSEVGLKLDDLIDASGSTIRLSARGAWLHDYSSLSQNVPIAYASDPTNMFGAAGAPVARDEARVALHADVALGRGLSIDLNGGGDFASTAHTYTGSAAIAYTW